MKTCSMEKSEKLLFYSESKDILFNYCHKPYVPVKPVIGKLKSENLLFESFRHESCGDEFYRFIEMLKTDFGLDSTVWGIKKANGNLFWEFYFYNYNKKDSRINVSNFLTICKNFFSSILDMNEKTPYFMFSADITKDVFRQKKIGGAHIYFSHLLTNSGHCYFKSSEETRIENIYHFFYDLKDDLRKIVAEVKNALFNDVNTSVIKNILIQELLPCKHICVAHKEDREGIYYSGITVDQFLFFLRKFEYPCGIIDFIEENKKNLDHLLYDIGFDYKLNQNMFTIIKSGYYGTT